MGSVWAPEKQGWGNRKEPAWLERWVRRDVVAKAQGSKEYPRPLRTAVSEGEEHPVTGCGGPVPVCCGGPGGRAGSRAGAVVQGKGPQSQHCPVERNPQDLPMGLSRGHTRAEGRRGTGILSRWGLCLWANGCRFRRQENWARDREEFWRKAPGLSVLLTSEHPVGLESGSMERSAELGPLISVSGTRGDCRIPGVGVVWANARRHQHGPCWRPLPSVDVAQDSLFSWPPSYLVGSFQSEGRVFRSSC